MIDGARCLDLFAGSGVIGLEALSRGARSVTFVDTNPVCVRAIAAELARLGDEGRGVPVEARARTFLDGSTERFDIVFLDPPFGRDELAPVLAEVAGGAVAPHGLIYLEAESPVDALVAARTDLRIVRSGRAGRVHFGLAAPVSPAPPVAS